MIKYRSTRGDKKTYTFSQAILKGIADDGGLLVPEKIPTFTLEELALLKHTSYAEKALFLLKLFETDFSDETVKKITGKAYENNFDNPKITPLVHLKENEYILELWHGPTWAFKDMALQLMPLLFEEAIISSPPVVRGNQQKFLILVATSGDTGKAALEGFKNKENISIIVLFPDKGISSMQERSMMTQEGNNVQVYPLFEDFDGTQQLVKAIFNDKDFNKMLFEDYKVSLSAANSINWGRLVPQMIYYVSSYIDLVEKGVIKLGDEVDYAIPSGNFGNMLAGYIAKRIGLPIRKLISASNENNILVTFLQTGVFDASKRVLIKTPSPAMDILIPSNIERLLYFLTNDSEKTTLWMQEIKEKRKCIVDTNTKKKLQELFYADWVNNQDCLQTIKNTFEETHYIIDPHTAVAVEVVNRYKKKNPDNTPLVICSTAHWVKFPEAVYSALKPLSFRATKESRNLARSLHSPSQTWFGRDDNGDSFKIIEKIQKYANSPVPKGLLTLKEKPILHKEKLEAKKEIIENAIYNFLDQYAKL